MDGTGIKILEMDNRTHAEKIAELERQLLPTSSLECPIIHLFSPGIYMRGIFMKAGNYVLGHEHITQHPNFVLTGRALVDMNGAQEEIVAPCMFESSPGVRKLLIILEDMRWVTVHPNPTNEKDPKKLEEMFVIKSDAWLKYHAELETKNPTTAELSL